MIKRDRDSDPTLGSGVQLNVHFHTLVLEGMFATAPDDTIRFDPAPPPTDREVHALVVDIGGPQTLFRAWRPSVAPVPGDAVIWRTRSV